MSALVIVVGSVLALDGVRVATLVPLVAARHRVTGVAVTAVLAAVVVLVAPALLDAAEVSKETFQIGGGLVAAGGGLRRIIVGPGRGWPPGGSWPVPVVFPVGLAPELVTWAGAAGAVDRGATLLGLVIGGAAAAATTLVRVDDAPRRALADGWVRLTGAGLVLAAVAMIIDGIRSV